MALVGFVVIIFSISNHREVQLDFWPLPFTRDVPIYVVAIAASVFGFFAGGIVAWFSGGRMRRRARFASRHAQNLEKDLTTLKERIGDLESDKKSKPED